MSADSRLNMIESAASLISTGGMSATSFSDVVAKSGAPRGSIYHHFPEGKAQLTREAILWTSSQVLGYLEKGPTDTPQNVFDHFVNLWRLTVIRSKAKAGCAVAGVAVDSSNDPNLLRLVRETFQSWSELFARQLEQSGLTKERANAIAQTVLAAMEGALILCRAEGSETPLEAIAKELERLL